MLTQTTARYATTIRIFLFALASVLLPVGLSACSEEESPETDSIPSPSQDASGTPAPEEIADPFEAAVVAYQRYWATVAEATAIPDPAYAPLAQVASGEALETARGLAQAALDAGERDTGAPAHEAAVTEAYPEDNPTDFVVTDCSNSGEWITVDADSGEPVAGEEYGTRQIQALVEHVDGRWLVTEVVILGIGSCLLPASALSQR